MPRRIALLLAVAAAAAAGSANAAVPRWPAWICKPGLAKNWCDSNLTTTAVLANGTRHVFRPAVSPQPIDCFYVYPSISTERRPNSDLVVHTGEAYTAVTQAAQFAPDCAVYAPMYHQVTSYAGKDGIAPGNFNLEYMDVLAAWRDYLAHDNHGHGVVLIGHSEGSFILERLLQAGVVPKKLLVSAILLGGDVQVDSSNRFAGLPACSSQTKTGCIVAYSSWDRTPPADAGLQSSGAGKHVLCVNPAAPGSSASATITPWFTGVEVSGIITKQFLPFPETVWISFPDMYTAQCVRQGRRAWLLVKRIPHPGDARETVSEIQGSERGLHPADVNIALTQLVQLVGRQAKAYRHR
jgi:hypothetical protein